MGSAPNPTEQIRDLFYRCKFRDALQAIEGVESATGNLSAELRLVRANALFELHRVEDARAVLAEGLALSTDQPEMHGGYEFSQYALARFHYCNDALEEARAAFLKVYENTESRNHEFRSLLGIANVAYTLKEFHKIPVLIEELCSFEPLERDDDRMSLTIFLGNYYLASGSSTELAKTYFSKALSQAAAKTWNYFVTRSIYGLALVAEKNEQHNELLWTLNILRSFVDESELLFFSHLVNERFANYFTINTPIEFDNQNKRIMVKDKWLAFHDKPLLYRFLEVLHQTQTFVGKDTLATDLWPDEEYKPRIHDPRIFDIAKRARQLIEAYEDQPVVLLSGRLGYKLAST